MEENAGTRSDRPALRDDHSGRETWSESSPVYGMALQMRLRRNNDGPDIRPTEGKGAQLRMQPLQRPTDAKRETDTDLSDLEEHEETLL